MCGIVGLTDPDSFHLLASINDLASYRGPDDRGEYLDPEQGVGLAMRRLSILDVEGGHQPMASEDESLWIVFNGEIFNSPELRASLEAKGRRFKTGNSDTEVLLHLYDEYGEGMLEDLNGMFSFVIHDRRRTRLFGARDRMGIKPFYYASENGRFAFASELKSLLPLPWVSSAIDFTSLYHYLSLQFVPAPDSIFADVKKLPAAHRFTYDLASRRLSVERYWDLDFRRAEERPVEDWIERIRETLKASIRRWTLSDVPIGCSLSGGLDSSSVVCFLAESGAADLRTYSLGFDDPEEQDLNELPLARLVAERCGTKHHEYVLKPGRVLQDLDRMVWHLDEPYGGGLPSWYIYELMGRNVKVALTGSGGDELFGNYGKYAIHEKSRWRLLLRNARQAVKQGSLAELTDGFRSPQGHFYHRYLSDAAKDGLLRPGIGPPRIRTEAYIQQIWDRAGTNDPRNAVAYVDFQMQLPEEFLAVTDRFSMAHSVEARVPFLDHTLVELVYRIPPSTRTTRTDPKGLLREAVKDVLPQELLDATKRGFVLPLRVWTRKDLKPLILELSSPDYLEKQGIFSSRVRDDLIAPHLSGQRDFTQQVWILLMFQLWYRTFAATV
jgi:asparagine synthase (glutamine-hydrolysing)